MPFSLKPRGVLYRIIRIRNRILIFSFPHPNDLPLRLVFWLLQEEIIRVFLKTTFRQLKLHWDLGGIYWSVVGRRNKTERCDWRCWLFFESRETEECEDFSSSPFASQRQPLNNNDETAANSSPKLGFLFLFFFFFCKSLPNASLVSSGTLLFSLISRC